MIDIDRAGPKDSKSVNRIEISVMVFEECANKVRAILKKTFNYNIAAKFKMADH